MKFFWCKNTRAFRIAWLLEESGLDYERVNIDIRDEVARGNAAFRAASPMGKVPALADGTDGLWDSGAICIYLADQYPRAGLGPPVGHADRGRFLQWTLYTNSVIEPAMMEKFSKAAPNSASAGWGSFTLMLDTLRAGLGGGPWILGDKFSAADVLLGTSCHFMRKFGMRDQDAVLDAYVARCMARPAWQRAESFDAS
ncbi:MAG: glutathione S-transferase family protein [Steroidobacteraceae bacterium]